MGHVMRRSISPVQGDAPPAPISEADWLDGQPSHPIEAEELIKLRPSSKLHQPAAGFARQPLRGNPIGAARRRDIRRCRWCWGRGEGRFPHPLAPPIPPPPGLPVGVPESKVLLLVGGGDMKLWRLTNREWSKDHSSNSSKTAISTADPSEPLDSGLPLHPCLWNLASVKTDQKDSCGLELHISFPEEGEKEVMWKN
ncbi:hypothetical protein chiPu_0014026 [Chiloscyllium punctatum]|uniref:Uncharacterized protein n=1 Tax=Chiloscyllium punctatum TaxID=137246 RepID=A0A401SYR2_CHIPU|nr:hypothetical protein [Chiloscyllium punctatum]